MGASRENRESEKILQSIWSLLPHLQVTVWHPLRDDAIEYAQEMQIILVRLIDQLRKERDEELATAIKSMDKTIQEPIKPKGK